MDDNSIMPFGKYKGEKMIDVPADYLLWLYETMKATGELGAYLEDNLQVIKDQIKRSKQ